MQIRNSIIKAFSIFIILYIIMHETISSLQINILDLKPYYSELLDLCIIVASP